MPRERILEALREARKAAPKRRFEQSIELMINLKDIDLKRPENRINLKVRLPNGVGKRRVLVFASGDLALRAREAGADEVIDPNELQSIAGDKKEVKRRLKDYDLFLAEAPLMPLIGRIVGPILGPRGKMPTRVPPQASIRGGMERKRKTILLRRRDKPSVMCIVGKEGMSDEEVAENIEAVFSTLLRTLKKGMGNIKSAYLKLTMGPAVRLI
ncbi:MAG TPA: 50S ribosomal protein L1 [Candidatus Bathyarchaeota archaeon]|nr:50S ribosomal protein L1 [Candidatus Bathyarchaeota archaeon]